VETSPFELRLDKEPSNLLVSSFCHICLHLILVRSDWRLSYDNGDGAFVPSEDILNAILDEKDHTFENVSLPSLQ
jgi:hypothetical protein